MALVFHGTVLTPQGTALCPCSVRRSDSEGRIRAVLRSFSNGQPSVAIRPPLTSRETPRPSTVGFSKPASGIAPPRRTRPLARPGGRKTTHWGDGPPRRVVPRIGERSRRG